MIASMHLCSRSEQNPIGLIDGYGGYGYGYVCHLCHMSVTRSGIFAKQTRNHRNRFIYLDYLPLKIYTVPVAILFLNCHV